MVRDASPNSVDETVDSTRQRRSSRGDEGAPRGRLKRAHPLTLDLTIDLGAHRVVLGRSPDEDASPSINDPTVSRAHFAIEWDAARNQHIGVDLSSKNGSWIDGRVATPGTWHVLQEGSVVRVGDVIFVYEHGHTFDHLDSRDIARANVPGEALVIRKLRTELARAAPDRSPVLIIGETGTGKELIAQEVHRVSGRKGDFVAVNCATLGEQLIESQLFGHVKGAFTGATTDSAGLFRAAEGGTIFLDEIGEMPKELQPKLLRAIQEREIRAVGSAKSEKVDVRVVAATHRDLGAQARAGIFRQDLYARLALWEIHVPSLRDRRADLLAWITHLHTAWQSERKMTAAALDFDAESAEMLLLSTWPENLRGLNRLVHELASQKRDDRIRCAHLPSWIRSGGA